MRIVFIGTPDFAVGILDALLQAGKNVVAVITAPDKPAGRGKKLQESAVKRFAVANGLPVLQPTNLKDEAFLSELKSYQAELQIVVAFRMMPEILWSMPKLGTFNLHASLLPQYRGAAPINWAIINGEKETGITTFFLKHKIDTGDILDQQSVAISEDDNAGSLHDKLMQEGAKLVVSTLNRIEKGDLTTTPQDHLDENQLKTAPKIFKPFCRLDWNSKGVELTNKIRGLSPYPCAFTRVISSGKSLGLKIYSASFETTSEGMVGEVHQNKSKLGVSCLDGIVWFHEIQLEGKKRMQVGDFLRGYNDSLVIES